MNVAFLVAAAAVVLLWPQIVERAKQLRAAFDAGTIDRRHVMAALLLSIAAWSWLSRSGGGGTPTPAPEPDNAAISLRGRFVGSSAAADAATIGCLCDALADCVEQDGMLASPRLTTGVAIDDLRVAARDARMNGVSIGDRQPLVRDAIRDYLARPDVVGVGGGPLSSEQRAKWVTAFRTIARAADYATR